MAAVEGNSALKLQFQQLQQQQQKKMMRRKQIKGEKESKPDTATSIAFGVDDDLDLKLADPPVQTGSSHAEEKIQSLSDQIRELKDETGRLYKLLSERGLEVRQLKKKRDDMQSALRSTATSGLASDAAATKIVDLSKKVRELTAELQGEKTKTKQLSKKCLDLENELQTSMLPTRTLSQKSSLTGSSAYSSRTFIMEEITDRQSTEAELKQLQDKLKHTELKMSEQRNQCQSLRQELKMAQKVLAQEVGEGASIQSLMNTAGGWRGRAQQIITLQKKVNELKSQLDDRQSATGKRDLEEEMLASSTYRKTHNIDDRHKERLQKMDKERKEAQEKTVAELKALEFDHDTLKKKMDASKARNKVLTGEIKTLKQQMATFIEKGKHDDELIGALLKQQNTLKSALEENSKVKKYVEADNDMVHKQLTLKQQQEANMIGQLKVIVSEKEAKVKTLEDEINQMRLQSLQRAQLNSVNALFERAASATPRTGDDSTQASQHSSSSLGSRASTTACNARDDLGSITPISGSRQNESRSGSRQSNLDTDRPQSRKQSARGHSSGGADRQVLEDLQRQCQEYKCLYQATSVERDKLTELVKVIQQRLDDAIQKVTDSQNDLLTHKRKNVLLEKQLGKAKVDQSQSAKRSKTKTSISSASVRDSTVFDDESHDLDELEISLAIQRDENEALKAALSSTLQAKEEDLRLYTEMIEETKKVFLQGLRQYKQSQVPEPS